VGAVALLAVPLVPTGGPYAAGATPDVTPWTASPAPGASGGPAAPGAVPARRRANPSWSPFAAPPASSGEPAAAGARAPDAVTAEEAEAGLRSRTVVPRAGGRSTVVPGRVAAPGRGKVRSVRVEVERGLPVDGPRFAAFAMAVLNDPRSWRGVDGVTFARTDGRDADMVLLLASPRTTDDLCRPLDTRGVASCAIGGRVILTFHRWVNATPEYAADRPAYRRYLVNHEIGHLLGHRHVRCPRKGNLAPVMQQQTYGLKGCRPNSWPQP
jgi:hypothetical protein